MAGTRKSLRGRLLLDGGGLRGSCFHRTAVLVCQHDAEGAFGLILNRPAGRLVGDVLAGSLPRSLTELPLHVGGPVQEGALSFLHSDVFLSKSTILPNLSMGHSLEELIELSEVTSATRRLMVFAGYSGWSPGQLDAEVKRDAWLILPATLDIVFSREPATLWQRILRGQGGLHRLLADSPDDPALN